jgi:hypothetical protein
VLRPAIIYAFRKTKRLMTEENQLYLSAPEQQEWDARSANIRCGSQMRAVVALYLTLIEERFAVLSDLARAVTRRRPQTGLPVIQCVSAGSPGLKEKRGARAWVAGDTTIRSSRRVMFLQR